MRYYDVKAMVESGEASDIVKTLVYGKRNTKIKEFRDYYNGNQWADQGVWTDTTRSGKQLWNIKRENPDDMGVLPGDLQTFDVCKSTVSVYSSYARGNINEKNRVVIKDRDELTDFVNDSLDLDILISRTVTRASVDSYSVWKFRGKESEDLEGVSEVNEAKLKLRSIGHIEMIDGMQVFPIYLGDMKVGTIRIYPISVHDPMVPKKLKDGKGDVLDYMEIWLPNEQNKMYLYKFIEGEQFEAGEAPYDFDPHIYIVNKDNEFANIDYNNAEISDIEAIIPIQDTINKTFTEEGIIISKVAFPMIKVIKEMYDRMAEGSIDAEQLREDLSKVSLVAGKIISAPIERVDGQDIPLGVDTYIKNLFEQLYRITGIPKGVFVSEGMSGISEKTISAMMESLKRRIDEKRAGIEWGIKQYVYMLTGDESVVDATTVDWAEMFAMSKEEQANVIIDGLTGGVLDRPYALEKLMHVLGDGDKFKEVLGRIQEDDLGRKVSIEKERIQSRAEREINKEREARRKVETENTLLNSEIDNITSEL